MGFLTQFAAEEVMTMEDGTMTTTTEVATASSGDLLAVIMASFVTIFIFSLVAYAVHAFFLSMIFKKAGVDSKKAWIPFINAWTFFELGGQKPMMSVLLYIPFVNIAGLVFYVLAAHHIAQKFGKPAWFVALALLVPPAWFAWLALDKSAVWDGPAASVTPAVDGEPAADTAPASFTPASDIAVPAATEAPAPSPVESAPAEAPASFTPSETPVVPAPAADTSWQPQSPAPASPVAPEPAPVTPVAAPMPPVATPAPAPYVPPTVPAATPPSAPTVPPTQPPTTPPTV